jgi:hypothetical protein
LDFDFGEEPHNYCNECDTYFDDSFQLIDHVLEDEEEFDPYYLLPNEFKLHLGSLLRFMYIHAEEPEQIRMISQSTYVTLFAAEMGYDLVDELVEDMIVKSALQNLDEDIRKLLSKDTNEEGGA